MEKFSRPEGAPEQHDRPELRKRLPVRVLRSIGDVEEGWYVQDLESEHKINSKTLVMKPVEKKLPNGKVTTEWISKPIPTIELYALNPEIHGITHFPITEWMKLWNIEEPDPLLKIRERDLTQKELAETLTPDKAKDRLHELAAKVKEKHEDEEHPIIPIEEYVKNLERREKLFGLSPGERYELTALREAIKEPPEEEPEEFKEAA